MSARDLIMNDLIDKNIASKKSQLLEYYRSRSAELSANVKQTFSDSEYKKRAAAVNQGLAHAKDNLVKIIEQKGRKENWQQKCILEGVLLVTYTNYIVMIEARNAVWPYEYMTFSRRIGEIWEPFCQLCWEYGINKELAYFVPPLFKDVKRTLTQEIEELIDSLQISDEQRKELKAYYQKVWNLVTSGEIKLELDLHFQAETKKYVVDFKSGFSSNEKGNTNRLLLVASVYKILEGNYHCLMFVRSVEDRNNHYLQILKNSGLWAVYCGSETYDQICKFTKFNLAKWLSKNVNWEEDFDSEMFRHLQQNNLTQYLQW